MNFRSLGNLAGIVIAAASLALVLMPGAACAEDTHDEHHGSHDFHANVFGVFGGITDEDHHDPAFTLGLEYERRLSAEFGIGVIAERAFGDLDFSVYAVPFAYHAGHLKLYAAPGIEDSRHHGSEFLFRLGAEYGFAVGEYEISPQFNIDFVDGEEALVLGLVFARGF